MQEFDFIIIGSGSAGSVMANRLSEDGKNTVLVLEFGGSDRGPFIQMPSALSYPMNMNHYNWGFETEPEPYLGGRRLATPRGKVIGGSSSINGMVYVRGHARDFDAWEEMGAKGWGYRHVLPYFKRMENSHGGEEGWRGTDGPMHVKRGRRLNPLYQAFVEAGREAGYPVTPDYNGHQQEGFGPMEMTVHNGFRWSAANAYLRPALRRGNVKLVTRAYAHRVILEGKRAAGVEYDVGGEVDDGKARREVIVAASSINSPKILQLSGIGAPEVLKAAGIPVDHVLPGVGENLHDHLEIYFQMESKQPVTLYSSLNLFSKGMIGLEWLLFKTGSAPPIILNPAALSARRPASNIPTSSIISCPPPCAMTARWPSAATASRSMSAPCAPSRGGLSVYGIMTPRPRRKFCSTTCRIPMTGRNSAPACA